MWRAIQSRQLRQPQPPQPTPVGAMDALPTEIQNTILACLPAGEVVRSSILSPAWRRRWESVPNLDIDLDLTGVRSWATATTMLQRCAAPVGSFHLRGVPPSLADAWLLLVAGKRPHSVSLDLAGGGVPTTALPAIFACDPAALAELSLRSSALTLPPVGFAGFRALSTLSLERVVFLAEEGWRQLEKMLAAAPGLEELRLKDIVFHVADGSFPGKWVIGGPSLRRVYLCLRLACAGLWELASLPQLECAHVFLNDSSADRDYVKLLTKLSGVRELHLGKFDGTTYQAPLLTGSLSPRFQNLMVLKLDTNFYALSEYIATWSLLQQVPLLQVLEIMHYFGHGEVNKVDLVAGCMHTTLGSHFGLLKNLEYLRMIGISCAVNDMYFIKHVLHEANNLKEVSVDMFEGSRKSAQEASRELKECQRASAVARISIKHGDAVCDV